MKIKKISIIIPAYNEEKTVLKTVRRVLAVRTKGIKKELVVVNDGSTDKTGDILKSIKDKRVILIDKKKNQGKGAAIRDALKKTSGDVIVIQDADLEYNPEELTGLIKPIENDTADVVYGSRFMGGAPHRVLLFWHMVGNNFLTLLTNMVSNLNLTDMETCYKMFTRDIAGKLRIEENRFGFEPEFTIKISKVKARVYEMGISYSGRGYTEGKKINWKDGLWAIWCIFKYGLLY